MKKILLLIQLFVAVCLTACYTNVITDYEGEGEGGNPSNQFITLPDPAQLDQTAYADSPSCQITFTTSAAWESYILNDEARSWVTITPSAGEEAGEHTIQILLDENTTGSSRTVQIALNCLGQTETITINQEAIRQDGSYPESYEPDPFEALVERIIITEVTEGMENRNNWLEFRFGYNGEQIQYIEKIGIYTENIEGEEIQNGTILSNININYIPEDYRLFYEQNTYQDNNQVTQRLYSECTLNKQGHIRENQVTYFDLMNEGEPEKPVSIIYSYKNFRLQTIGGEQEQFQYIWSDQNRVETQEKITSDAEYATLETFTYTTEENNKANLDLNQLYQEDYLSMAGFLGKRSQNLLATISDKKGSRTEFIYTFNSDGYIETITATHFFEGIENPTKQVYTIFYQGL